MIHILSPFQTFKNSIKEIGRKKFSYFYMFFQLVYFSGLVRQFGTDGFLIFNFVFSFMVFLAKGRKLEPFIFKIILVLLILFIIPVVYWNQLNIRLYIGFIIRIINGYLILRIFDDEFVSIFVNLVFLLSFISIPLFIIQIISPEIFNVFTSLSNKVLSEDRIFAGHKYFFVFLFNAWGESRNSGFMWEPAAFGGVLAWAIMFSFFQNKMNFNTKSYTMLFAMLTTFSLGTFLYIIIITLFFITVNLKKTYQLILPGLLIFIIFINSPFLNDMKIMMEEKMIADQDQIEGVMVYKEDRQSRTAGMIVSFEYFLKFPLGYGFIDDEEAGFGFSPNGISIMLIRWGLLGISIFFYSISILVRYLSPSVKLKPIPRVLAIICFALPFMGNPFYNQPFIFSFLLLPFVLKSSYKSFIAREINKQQDIKMNF